MNIANFGNKIKGFLSSVEKHTNREVGTVLIIILVGFVSFGLGKLSSEDMKREPIKIIKQENLDRTDNKTKNQEANIASVSSGFLVASKKGTKYHYPWCSGAKRTKEENKIYFPSFEEARKAGYTPAGNCKGLK